MHPCYKTRRLFKLRNDDNKVAFYLMLQKVYKDILALHEVTDLRTLFFTLSLPSLCAEMCIYVCNTCILLNEIYHKSKQLGFLLTRSHIAGVKLCIAASVLIDKICLVANCKKLPLLQVG